MLQPFYQDDSVTLYHGDALALMPLMPTVDAVITDPPYGETSLEWDRWPKEWPNLAAALAPQLWCFGSMRMFFEKRDDFVDWKLAQDIVWEKQNGSSLAADRFRRVHELVLHFYRGSWAGLYKSPQYTYDATEKAIRRKSRPAHWGGIGEATYRSEDGGPRLTNSVIYARNCHGYAVNETQKPEAIVTPIIDYSVPRGGILLDCFAGSGTALAIAKKTGRRAIGIEKRLSQCELIVDRLRQSDLFCAA